MQALKNTSTDVSLGSAFQVNTLPSQNASGGTASEPGTGVVLYFNELQVPGPEQPATGVAGVFLSQPGSINLTFALPSQVRSDRGSMYLLPLMTIL